MGRVDAEALIADLDPDQRAAVTTESHLVAVIAGIAFAVWLPVTASGRQTLAATGGPDA